MELENKVSDQQFNGKIGIGHTRWATHGLPTEMNAHPHKAHGVSLVQNGIIENYAELKADLLKEGAVFSSETDTEVVTHLIAKEMKSADTLVEAVRKVIPKLRGAYAMLVVDETQPDTIIAFKAGPPLLLGVGEGELFLASDVQAFVEHTNKVVYLNDYEIVEAQRDQFKIMDLEGAEIRPRVESVNVAVVTSDKKGFKHYMLKEMYEQPRAVANALNPYIDLEARQVDFSHLGLDSDATNADSLEALNNIDRIIIVACGTSYYAGLYAKYLIEPLAKLPVEVDVASEFRYRDPVLSPNTLTLFISQSGETADTLAALRLAKNHGLLTMSICNTRRSTIDREADLHLYMNSGVEVGVASTKAFLSTLAILNLLSIRLATQTQAISKDEESNLVESLLALPSLMEGVLAYDSFFDKAADTLKSFKGFLYLGRGHSFPIAMEGALKMKELAYLHAEGYAAGEMKHGPLALIDERMVVVGICPKDKHYEKTMSNLEEAKARGGVIISIGTGQDSLLSSMSEHYLSIPECHWMVSGLLSVIPVQLLAYHVAERLGHDVDQPRNLAKSVTVE